jgi:metal-responsive CopG/Arc/MetJ family transcriptional regulator
MAKVMVSLPDELLERVDAEARRRATTRSALLRDAVSRELIRRDPATVRRAIEEARALFDGTDAFESAQLIRAERERLDARDGRRAGAR